MRKQATHRFSGEKKKTEIMFRKQTYCNWENQTEAGQQTVHRYTSAHLWSDTSLIYIKFIF